MRRDARLIIFTVMLMGVYAAMAAISVSAQEVLPSPEPKFKRTIGQTYKDSTPDKILLIKAPAPPRSLSDTVPLYTNLGSHHKRISTRVPATQQYFDQGLRLLYGFNHAEAIRSFTRAAALDPTCAMCYWGIALAYGPHVNAPMDSASGVAAYAAAQKAQALTSHATAPERA